MRVHLILAVTGVCFVAGAAGVVHGATRKAAPSATADPSPLPKQKPPTINPESPPSASLGPLLNTYLDKILAPLGTAAFTQVELVDTMKSAYGTGLTNAPEARKPAYVLALAICGALTEAMNGRGQAVDALAMSSQRTLAEGATPAPKRGKKPATAPGADATFFAESQKNNWRQNAAALRQRILTLNTREQAAEARAGVWPLPTPAPTPTPAVAVATPTPAPSVSVPAPGADPVIGDWRWAGRSKVKFGADNTITGMRNGTWVYLGTQEAGRCYAVYWSRSGMPDSVVLTMDGKALKGRTKAGKEVTATR